VTPDFDQWAASLAKIPVYAFVGALDTTVPPERSERMIAAIKKAGGKQAKLKVYPAEGHGAGGWSSPMRNTTIGFSPSRARPATCSPRSLIFCRPPQNL
jgi:dienelactone hydrolase